MLFCNNNFLLQIIREAQAPPVNAAIGRLAESENGDAGFVVYGT